MKTRGMIDKKWGLRRLEWARSAKHPRYSIIKFARISLSLIATFVLIISTSNCQVPISNATTTELSSNNNNATEEHLILSAPTAYVDFHTETPILLFDNLSNNDTDADNSTTTTITTSAPIINLNTTIKLPSISETPTTTSKSQVDITTTVAPSNEENATTTTSEDDEEDLDANNDKMPPFVVPQNVSQYMDYIERLFHDLRHQVSYFFEPHIPQLIRTSQMVELSPPCSHDILRMALALRQLEPWALKMIDSSGKLPEGIFEGSFTSLGSYDQCLNIVFTVAGGANAQNPSPTVNATTATTSLATQGKYCLVNVSPFLPPKPSPFERVDRLFQEEANRRNYSKDDQLSRLSPMFYYMRFRIGICVPSTCELGDMSSISQALSSSLKLNITIDTCRLKQPRGALSSQQLVSGCIAAAVLLLVLVATFLDYWRQSSDQLRHKEGVEICLVKGANYIVTEDRPLSRVMRIPTSNHDVAENNKRFQVITDFGQANDSERYVQEACSNVRAKNLNWAWRSFSLIANFKLYFKATKQNQNRNKKEDDGDARATNQVINCLNGIRVISLCWVIVANSYVTLDPRATKGLTRTREAPRDFLFQIIVQASLAIETFFFLSGLLMSLTFSRHEMSNFKFLSSQTKRGALLTWLRFYLHRYIRLTAPAMLVIALAMFTHRYGDGPLWHEVTDRAHLSCSQNWWRHLLHVANYIDTRQSCFIHYWYIAADMQLFLVAPILLLLLNKFARLGMLLIGSLSISSIYWIFHTTLVRNLPPTLLFYSSDPESRREFGNTIMTKPYTHLLPYLVGMLLGHWLNNSTQSPENLNDGENKHRAPNSNARQPKNRFDVTTARHSEQTLTNSNKFVIMEASTIMKLLGLLASLIVLAEIFLPYLWNNSQFPAPWLASLYAALFRLGWALSLAYLVISCRHKQTSDCVTTDNGQLLANSSTRTRSCWCWCGSGGTLMNQFLSLTIFKYLSRLSFVAYLIHLPLMSVFVAQTRAIFAFSHMLVIHLALSYLLMTFILSFVLVHIIEFPFVTFERYLFEQFTTTKTKQTTDIDHHHHQAVINRNQHPKSNYTISLNSELQHQQQRDSESKENPATILRKPVRA